MREVTCFSKFDKFGAFVPLHLFLSKSSLTIYSSSSLSFREISFISNGSNVIFEWNHGFCNRSSVVLHQVRKLGLGSIIEKKLIHLSQQKLATLSEFNRIVFSRFFEQIKLCHELCVALLKWFLVVIGSQFSWPSFFHGKWTRLLFFSSFGRMCILSRFPINTMARANYAFCHTCPEAVTVPETE